MDLISVIIPVYNTAEYLSRCLDSVLNNTYQHLEVICVDDGSTDNSAEILHKYALEDSRVVIITQENAGVSAARNAGLDHANGEYIAFVDSDDWVHKQYFEFLLQGITLKNADIAICGHIQTDRFVTDDEIPQNHIVFRKHTLSHIAMYKGIERYIWGRVYRRTLIADHRFVHQVKLAEDSIFNLNIVCSNDNLTCVVCDCQLYYYYTRWASASHTLSGKELLPLIMWYLDHVSLSDTKSKLYIFEALKALYSWRYGALLMKSKDELKDIRHLLHTAMGLLLKSTQIPLKDKIAYSMMTAIPFIYRIFRLSTDSTMIYWEKKMKAKKR